MNLIVEFRNRARQVFGSMLAVSAVIYFAYHAVNGDRGLMAWLELQDKVAAAETWAGTIAVERRGIENRVKLLYPESLDPDMLEERARIMLNYAHAGDIVVMDKMSGGPSNDRRSIR